MNNSKIKLASTIDTDIFDHDIPCEPCDCDDESTKLHFDCVDLGILRGELYDDASYDDEIDPSEYLDPKEFLSPEQYQEYLKRKQDEPPQDPTPTSTDDVLKDMPF